MTRKNDSFKDFSNICKRVSKSSIMESDVYEYAIMGDWGSIFDFSGQDYVELFLWDQAVLVDIGTADQLVDFLLRDVLSQLCRDSS